MPSSAASTPKISRHCLAQRVDVPFLRVDLLAGVGFDGAVEQVFGERHQVFAAVDGFFVSVMWILPSSSSRRSA